MKYLYLCGLLSLSMAVCAQNKDSVHVLKEVLITGFYETPHNETVLNISALNYSEFREMGAFNISDGLSHLAGITQLSTGVAISKPVIRGLYGNRVLTLLSSLKFDNQQWQDEHGLGLSDIGIERVELIKGPLSILYGSEAVGGIVNVLEEAPAPMGTYLAEVNTRFLSNTLGNQTDVGLKKTTERHWWRLRIGAESDADYTDGHNNRVLNSRFGGYYLKGSFGFHKGNWSSVNNYDGSINNFGFIMEDSKDFLVIDNRWTRSFLQPHHSVYLNVLSSQNTIFKNSCIWKINVGVQSNLRMEAEGGGKISLNMHLLSLPTNIQWIKHLNSDNELIISNISSLEKNTNYGSRIIIPDAWMFEEGISGYFRSRKNKFIFETGIGVNSKYIHTYTTPPLNDIGKEIQPFARNKISENALFGIVFNQDQHWNVKLNGSTGFRSPNLAELSSNGLHEGIFRYEIGKPDLKNEQNLNIELSLNYVSKVLNLSAAIFNNRFYNYIYLAPTSEDFYGFPVARYRQNNADLSGLEISAIVNLTKNFSWTNSFSTVEGKLFDGSYLPFIPASKISSQLKQTIPRHKMYVFGGFDYVFAQNKPALKETPTPAYHVVNVGFGGKIKNISVNLSVNNLFNAYYFDHLSRFKAYGIYNIGRNIVLNFNIPLSRKTN